MDDSAHPVIQSVMLGEWRQSFLSTASTYFIHIFYIISCILVRTKVLHMFLLLFTPKARVISVIFRGEHRKIDAELLSTFTKKFLYNAFLQHFSPKNQIVLSGQRPHPWADFAHMQYQPRFLSYKITYQIWLS